MHKTKHRAQIPEVCLGRKLCASTDRFLHQHLVEIPPDIVTLEGRNMLDPFNIKVISKQLQDLLLSEMIPSWAVPVAETD